MTIKSYIKYVTTVRSYSILQVLDNFILELLGYILYYNTVIY